MIDQKSAQIQTRTFSFVLNRFRINLERRENVELSSRIFSRKQTSTSGIREVNNEDYRACFAVFFYRQERLIRRILMSSR